MTTMTVRQLIEKLEEYGDDLPVYFLVVTERNSHYSICTVDYDSYIPDAPGRKVVGGVVLGVD